MLFLRLNDVCSSALYEEKRSRFTAAALTFDGRHEVKRLVLERILSNRSFCFIYACFKAWFLNNSEVFWQMLSAFFIFISIGLRSVNPLGIKLKKLHCDRNAMSDHVLASFIHNTSIARLTRREVASNFSMKRIVTNKYASRVLEYNYTNNNNNNNGYF